MVLFQWREVARELEGVIRIGAVNCQDEWHLCRMQGIGSYPSLLMYPAVILSESYIINRNLFVYILKVQKRRIKKQQPNLNFQSFK